MRINDVINFWAKYLDDFYETKIANFQKLKHNISFRDKKSFNLNINLNNNIYEKEMKDNFFYDETEKVVYLTHSYFKKDKFIKLLKYLYSTLNNNQKNFEEIDDFLKEPLNSLVYKNINGNEKQKFKNEYKDYDIDNLDNNKNSLENIEKYLEEIKKDINELKSTQTFINENVLSNNLNNDKKEKEFKKIEELTLAISNIINNAYEIAVKKDFDLENNFIENTKKKIKNKLGEYEEKLNKNDKEKNKLETLEYNSMIQINRLERDIKFKKFMWDIKSSIQNVIQIIDNYYITPLILAVFTIYSLLIMQNMTSQWIDKKIYDSMIIATILTLIFYYLIKLFFKIKNIKWLNDKNNYLSSNDKWLNKTILQVIFAFFLISIVMLYVNREFNIEFNFIKNLPTYILGGVFIFPLFILLICLLNQKEKCTFFKEEVLSLTAIITIYLGLLVNGGYDNIIKKAVEDENETATLTNIHKNTISILKQTREINETVYNDFQEIRNLFFESDSFCQKPKTYIMVLNESSAYVKENMPIYECVKNKCKLFNYSLKTIIKEEIKDGYYFINIHSDSNSKRVGDDTEQKYKNNIELAKARAINTKIYISDEINNTKTYVKYLLTYGVDERKFEENNSSPLVKITLCKYKELEL